MAVYVDKRIAQRLASAAERQSPVICEQDVLAEADRNMKEVG